jgi:hypothetical protein
MNLVTETTELKKIVIFLNVFRNGVEQGEITLSNKGGGLTYSNFYANSV